MTSLTVVLCFAIAVAVADAQKKPCCYPDAFETSFGLQTGEDTPDTHGMVLGGGMAKIFADYKNQRMAIQLAISTGGKMHNITELMLGKKKTMYVVENGKCKKFPMKEFPSNCIPSDATYSGTLNLGMATDSKSGQTMTLDNWVIVKTNPGYFYLSLMVLPDNCMPVCQGGGGVSDKHSMMFGDSYFNTHLGIKDPRVFDVPSICNDAEFESGNPPELPSRKIFFLSGKN